VFADRAKIHVQAGAGGNGAVSFRREAHVPRGGGDGGDGGRGRDVVLLCDPSRRDLAALRRAPHIRAGRGEHGKGEQRQGARVANRYAKPYKLFSVASSGNCLDDLTGAGPNSSDPAWEPDSALPSSTGGCQ
jgi:GTPase involved in cell partitioning and DNA repair